MSDNWDEINRRAELVEVLTSIMERIYPVWVADTRAGELVEALEKWLDSRIENIDGGPADETTAALTTPSDGSLTPRPERDYVFP